MRGTGQATVLIKNDGGMGETAALRTILNKHRRVP